MLFLSLSMSGSSVYHSPQAVPGPNSFPDSIMDWPSSSWLFIRVGAFFSSFSYTNSSSRTSADRNKKTQLQSHKTTVREPNIGSDLRTVSPNSLTFVESFHNGSQDKENQQLCFMLSHHVNEHRRSQSVYLWYAAREYRTSRINPVYHIQDC